MGFFKTIRDMMTSEKVDFKEKINQGAVALDVRTVAEFKSGHAKGSINVPLDQINARAKEFTGKDVVVVCKSGMRSAQAKQTLQSHGVNCYNAGAWQNIA